MVVLPHEVPRAQASHTPHIYFLVTFLPFPIKPMVSSSFTSPISLTLQLFPLSESFDSNHQTLTPVHYFTLTASHPLGYDFTTIMM